MCDRDVFGGERHVSLFASVQCTVAVNFGSGGRGGAHQSAKGECPGPGCTNPPLVSAPAPRALRLPLTPPGQAEGDLLAVHISLESESAFAEDAVRPGCTNGLGEGLLTGGGGGQTGHTPLHEAAYSGNQHVVEAILDKGVDINMQTIVRGGEDGRRRGDP